MDRDPSPLHGVVRSERLDLILLDAQVMDALIAGQKERAQALIGFSLPASFPEEHSSASGVLNWSPLPIGLRGWHVRS